MRRATPAESYGASALSGIFERYDLDKIVKRLTKKTDWLLNGEQVMAGCEVMPPGEVWRYAAATATGAAMATGKAVAGRIVEQIVKQRGSFDASSLGGQFEELCRGMGKQERTGLLAAITTHRFVLLSSDWMGRPDKALIDLPLPALERVAVEEGKWMARIELYLVDGSSAALDTARVHRKNAADFAACFTGMRESGAVGLTLAGVAFRRFHLAFRRGAGDGNRTRTVSLERLVGRKSCLLRWCRVSGLRLTCPARGRFGF
jgi:hypothetical protein